MTQTPECRHHWLIEAAGSRPGGKSLGVCRQCGAERLFANTLEDFENLDLARRGRKGAKRRHGLPGDEPELEGL